MILIYKLNQLLNNLHIQILYVIITFIEQYTTMLAQQKLIKIPNNLVYQIQQLEPTTETLYYFTIFTTQNEGSYILDISRTKQQNLPFSLKQQCKFSQRQQKISKQNKVQIINKYTLCTCDQFNQMSAKYIMINIVIQRYIDVPVQVVGFSVNLHKNRVAENQKTNYQVTKFQQIIKICLSEANDIKSNYNSRYSRSLADKKLKENVELTYGLQPFLQFQVSALTSPQFNNDVVRKIQQIEGDIKSYPFIFSLKVNSQQEKVQNKIKDFINQKLLQKSNKSSSSSIGLLKCPNANPKKIFNPHIFAKYTKKERYEIITVKGVYQYYHYGDQNFTDNGWGCAYRALQTLLSWLHIQGYTAPMSEMISIRAIQQKLDQFDRSRKLKGSSTWIGATEISWLVPTITYPQINCKILHVSDGKQILEKCEQFKQHFLTSGCPIMYGGGEYAYSIVGMHYNWKLGECQFLILDPHYTGEDDYGKILEKKGLAWRKPQQMFKKGVFYNFCLPLIK